MMFVINTMITKMIWRMNMIRKMLKTKNTTEYVKFADCYYCKCKYALIGYRSELLDTLIDYCPICGNCKKEVKGRDLHTFCIIEKRVDLCEDCLHDLSRILKAGFVLEKQTLVDPISHGASGLGTIAKKSYLTTLKISLKKDYLSEEDEKQ